MLEKFLRVEFCKTVFKFRKRKFKSVPRASSRPNHKNVKLGSFTMYWRNDGNEVYKKRGDAHAEFVLCLLNLKDLFSLYVLFPIQVM